MATARRVGGGTRGRRAAIAMALAGGAALTAAVAPAVSGSTATSGRMVSEDVAGSACASPVGLCTRGALKGALKGAFTLTVTSTTATADSPTTGVILYTADVEITTDEGTLFCKDAGALGTTDDRSAASVCRIIGGTGGFLGADGRLRITGLFPAFGGDEAGKATFEGNLIIP